MLQEMSKVTPSPLNAGANVLPDATKQPSMLMRAMVVLVGTAIMLLCISLSGLLPTDEEEGKLPAWTDASDPEASQTPTPEQHRPRRRWVTVLPLSLEMPKV